MKDRREWPAFAIVLIVLFLVCCAVFVLGQGGTGRETPNANANKNRPVPKKTPSPKKTPKSSRSNTNGNANSKSTGSDAADSGGARTTPPPPVSLQSFEFVTTTVDSSGKATSHDRKSAEAYTEDLGGGVKLEMVSIPPGEFMMGTQDKSSDEYPQHHVRINYSFYMGKFEVTQAQWRAVMGSNPSSFKDCDECPVETVSWNDAVEFCRKLSARTGREYRLPSEAEWEYAARAGTTSQFAFGPTVTPEIVNYDGNYPYGSAAKGASRQKTVPVGSLGVANGLGLYDMHGNVWEWCQDVYHDSYSVSAGDAPTDGSAWIVGADKNLRVLRGGSWGYIAYYTRSAYRHWVSPTSRNNNVGFRLVAIARTN
jgi:formylglycine-generating enzyme required for sulfatase activity